MIYIYMCVCVCVYTCVCVCVYNVCLYLVDDQRKITKDLFFFTNIFKARLIFLFSFYCGFLPVKQLRF